MIVGEDVITGEWWGNLEHGNGLQHCFLQGWQPGVAYRDTQFIDLTGTGGRTF